MIAKYLKDSSACALEVGMRVVIADDQALFREGLRSLLEAHGLEIVAEASNGQEAVEVARAQEPDVVLMDLDMPEMNGLVATRLIKAAVPSTRVIILTASEQDTDLFEAIKSGAQGYLMKSVRADELSRLLDGAIRGEPALTPDIASKLLGEFAHPTVTRHERGSDELTEREREVLELLVQGVTSNKELADRLVVSENTVKYHLRNILDKLHANNRAQVIAFATQHGIVGQSPS
jgi:DNA-binding NarL/FixJ family response regulator